MYMYIQNVLGSQLPSTAITFILQWGGSNPDENYIL